jgi:hypothetical protein
LVQGSGQLAVGRSGSLQFIGTFIELTLDVGEVLLQHRDALLKLVDVGWRSEAGIGPSGLTEGLGEALLQLPDPCGEAFVPFQGVGQVGVEGGPADGCDSLAC